MYYKGNSFFNNKHLDAYVQAGEKYVKVGEGYRRVKIADGTTKYNYAFLLRSKELIHKYSCLMRLDFLVKNIMEQTEDSHGDVRNMWNLIMAQNGTRKYLYTLNQRLKTTKVNTQDVYNAIKHDLDSTEERYHRNYELCKTMMRDYGFDGYVDFVEKEKNKSIFEDIFDFYTLHQVDIDAVDSKAEKYDALDSMYIEEMMKFCEERGYKVEQSEHLLLHRKQQEIVKKQLQQEISAQNKAKKEEKCEQIADRIAAKVSNAIREYDTNAFSKRTLDATLNKLRLLGNIGYYILAIKRSNPLFVCEGTESKDLYSAIFFRSYELAENWLKDKKDENYYYCINSVIAGKEIKPVFDYVAGSNKREQIAYWVNSAVNSNYSAMDIGVNCLKYFRRNIGEGKQYLLINEENKFYSDKGYVEKISKTKLLSMEEAKEVITDDVKAFKLCYQEVITDKFLSTVFIKYDTLDYGIAKKLFTVCFNNGLKSGYLVLVYDKDLKKVFYLTRDFGTGKLNEACIFKDKPEKEDIEAKLNVGLKEQRYYVEIQQTQDYSEKYDKAMLMFSTALKWIRHKKENDFVIMKKEGNMIYYFNEGKFYRDYGRAKTYTQQDAKAKLSDYIKKHPNELYCIGKLILTA